MPRPRVWALLSGSWTQQLLAWAERWRYRADNARAAPRKRALEVRDGPPRQAVLDAVPLLEGWRAVDSFPEMTLAEIGADDLWKRVCAIPWKTQNPFTFLRQDPLCGAWTNVCDRAVVDDLGCCCFLITSQLCLPLLVIVRVTVFSSFRFVASVHFVLLVTFLSRSGGSRRKPIPAMPLHEFSATGGSLPSVPALRKRLLEHDPSGPLPGVPSRQRPAARLARSASGLVEATDNPPVSPHKRLRTELPSEPSVRRQLAISKREQRYTEWVGDIDRGVIYDGGLSYLEVRPAKPGTHKEYLTRVEHLNTFVLKEGLKSDLQLSVMDSTILIYMHFRFFAGYDHNDASKLLAAVAHLHPHVRAAGKLGLSRSSRCVKGWSKEARAR